MSDVDTAAISADAVNQSTNNTTEAAPIKLNEVIARYTKLRDAKAQAKQLFEKKIASIEAELEQLEGTLLTAMDAAGVESVRTESGTAYKQVATFASVADWQATLRYIREHEHWHLLQRAVNKKEIESLVNETGEVVPGVNLRRQMNVNVRRS